jgi:hypothetical protein
MNNGLHAVNIIIIIIIIIYINIFFGRESVLLRFNLYLFLFFKSTLNISGIEHGVLQMSPPPWLDSP